MKKPSQAAIGRALGLSPASMTKLKGMGMPVNGIDAARAWRQNNIKTTMNSPFDRQEMRKSKQPPSGAAPHALALMMIADAALASGHSIDAMVPVLRSALAAVPEYERNDTMLLSVDVMDMLVADVVAVLPPRGALNDDGSPAWHDDDNMNDDEAAAMGRFWYSVAAGEIVPATIFK